MAITNNNKQRIVIIGAGFAGLRFLFFKQKTAYEIFLVDKHNYHEFQPLMYQVATARLEPSSISFPLRKIFQHTRNVHIHIAEVQRIDTATRVVYTSIGDVSYDRLVVSLGCTTNFFGNQRIQSHSFPMKSVPNAMALRNRILQTFEDTIIAGPAERQALLNFVIVGGGPTGVELSGAMAEMKKYILDRKSTRL